MSRYILVPGLAALLVLFAAAAAQVQAAPVSGFTAVPGSGAYKSTMVEQAGWRRWRGHRNWWWRWRRW